MAESRTRIREGLPHPLGATWAGLGVNFALFSAHATQAELCLFDATGRREVERIEMPESIDERDSARFVPKCRVIDPAFTWTRDRRPGTRWERTVIYEAHVKGLTKRHPLVPEALRGTYAGLAWWDVVEHLKDLGVTAVELLPIHAFVDDGYLLDKKLTNYWG